MGVAEVPEDDDDHQDDAELANNHTRINGAVDALLMVSFALQQSQKKKKKKRYDQLLKNIFIQSTHNGLSNCLSVCPSMSHSPLHRPCHSSF